MKKALLFVLCIIPKFIFAPDNDTTLDILEPTKQILIITASNNITLNNENGSETTADFASLKKLLVPFKNVPTEQQFIIPVTCNNKDHIRSFLKNNPHVTQIKEAKIITEPTMCERLRRKIGCGKQNCYVALGCFLATSCFIPIYQMLSAID